MMDFPIDSHIYRALIMKNLASDIQKTKMLIGIFVHDYVYYILMSIR